MYHLFLVLCTHCSSWEYAHIMLLPVCFFSSVSLCSFHFSSCADVVSIDVCSFLLLLLSLLSVCWCMCEGNANIINSREKEKKQVRLIHMFFFPCGNLTFGCVSLGTSMRPKLSRTFNIHAYNGTGHSHTMPQQFRSIYEIRWISFDRERANERAHTPRVSCTRRTSHILYFDSVVFLHHIFTYSFSPSRGCFCLLAWLLQPI